MGKIKWGLILIGALILAAFFHYTLPQRDIVRVVGTYEERQDFGGWTDIFWSGGSAGAGVNNENRDALFIQTVLPSGKEMVYRNEDTGWGWPPYFKFDTANLQTRAADAVSDKDEPKWYAVRHYGWRITVVSSFPNALSIKPVDGPDVRLIPWFNIIFLTVLFLIVFAIYRRIQKWKDRRIDPVLEGIGDRFDDVSDSVSETGGRFSRWLGTWRSKKR